MDLQPLWPYSVKKPDFSDLGCSSRHVISKTKSVTPHFFYISDITNSSTFNGKILRKKSMLENFRANILNINFCPFDKFWQLPTVSMERLIKLIFRAKILILLNLKSGKEMISRGKQVINRGPTEADVALRNLFHAVLSNPLFVQTSTKYICKHELGESIF